MTDDERLLREYGQAVGYLPPRFRSVAMQIDNDTKKKAEEFRLRAGRGLCVTVSGRERELVCECPVRHEELNAVLELATRSSVHTSADTIRQGFVTVAGGHRIGLCGTGVTNCGEASFIKDLSSVSIRIAKDIIGASVGVAEKITDDRGISNTLIISPPGYGKTTMLRDLVRTLSDSGYRVSLVDERGELAAKYKGVAQFDVGAHTDIMDGFDKAEAAMLMLRTMTPDIIAVDEITASDDIEAMERIANCGVRLIATAHGDDVMSLMSRPLYRKMYELEIFKKAVVLKKENGEFRHSIEDI